MSHLEFAAAESAALRPTDWERWADKAEALAGHSLDGDQRDDGYSLDDAYQAWLRGESPDSYVRTLAEEV